MIKKEIIVEKNKKLVNILQDYGFSFADVNKMMRNKDVKVNGKVVKENIVVDNGDSVVFFYAAQMLEKKYDILYEEDSVYVVFKRAGIESEGEKGLESVLESAFAVHRLDRNTEGLMVFAKTLESKKKLEAGFKNNNVHKFYIAEVVGKFDGVEKTYKAFLIKDSENSFVRIYNEPVKGAVEIKTHVKPLKVGSESSILEIELLTGKTHQIRAHLAFLGHPLVGDGKYGKNEINKKFQENKQKLACFKLKFGFLGIESLNFKEFVRFPKWFEKEQ